jgi:glycerol-3-phosphate dehydrogenase
MGSQTYDVLVIGGGATGAGVALDAASRGLKTALVERDDFAAGTSSRSTKLIHGGVRYLEKAIKQFDRTQFNLVRDALKERSVLLKIAPHLARPLPLVTPLYEWIQVPYFMTGLKIYEWLAGSSNLAPSKYVDAKTALDRFPMLKADGLRAGVIYYDGQFDDARMNVALATTAADQNADVLNHASVQALVRDGERVAGADVLDHETGQTGRLHARAVINATGPFADAVRRMDDPDVTPMLTASSGIHIVLDERFSPPDTGLLIPETEDGRVLFLLPWLGQTLVGTTDNAARIEPHPQATEDDIEYVLRHIRQYFSLPVERSDVKAAWSGLRPLVSDPNASDTAGLSRDHVIHISDSGLLTIAGGKWTTYRKMALDTVDQAIELAGLTAGDSQTEDLPLTGGAGYEAFNAGRLQEGYGLDSDTAHHLNTAYGDQAVHVAELAREEGLSERISPNLPNLLAEAVHAVRSEFARSTTDVLARRTRVAFLDHDAAMHALDSVHGVLRRELGWDDARAEQDLNEARAYLS